MTHEGSTVCKQLEDYLISKLSKDHSGVKLKVLRIIRYLSDNGCSLEFRRSMQRRSDILRQCQSYRGSPDPLCGDSHNKAVRDEAQLALKALFDGVEVSVKSTYESGRIESMGNTVLDARPRRIDSMGNPNFDNYKPPVSSSFSSIMSSETPGRDLFNAVSTGVQSMVQRAYGSPSVVGSSSMAQSSMSSGGSLWVPPKLDSPVRGSDAVCEPLSSPVRKAISELCMSSMGRVSVSSAALNQFVSALTPLSNSDCVAIGEYLDNTSTSWIQKLKLLSGIEAMTLSMAQTEILLPSVMGLLSSAQCKSRAKILVDHWTNNPQDNAPTHVNLLLDIDTAVTPPTNALITQNIGITPTPLSNTEDLLSISPLRTFTPVQSQDLLDFNNSTVSKPDYESLI